jgi:glycosyltransferase involved in cell wall biosynthesis
MDFEIKADRGISAVCPVFNGEASLGELYHRLVSALSLVAAEYEIVFVNDQSSDKSWKIIASLAAQDPRVHGIDLMRNYGQHNALLCGIRAARFDTIVTLDDDLQHPPEEIAKLLERLDEGYDVVYGTPKKQQSGWTRALASKAVRLALRSAVGYEVAKNVSPFRAFRAQLREAFTGYHTSFVSVDVLLTWATTRFGAVSVRFDPRFAGSSNYTLSRLLSHALDMDDRFQHEAASTCEPNRFYLYCIWNVRAALCYWAVLFSRKYPRVSLSRLDHCNFFRRSALRSRSHR